MDKILLKKENVIKSVNSEEKALELEIKGFVRMDRKTVVSSGITMEELEAEHSGTKKQLESAVKKNKAAEKKNKEEQP